jgi:septal ring factor EnvC (AmiA/AmiB activator)
MQAAGQLSLLEYYERAYHQTAEGGYAPITEAVLVFAITGIREDTRQARADKEAVRDELKDASNRVSDLRTRLQCSELTAAALLDSLKRSQDTPPVARKHPRYK